MNKTKYIKFFEEFNEDFDEIDLPESEYLYVKESQIPKSGLGLFTSIPIQRGEIISVFSGDILSPEEASKSIDKRYQINLLDGNVMDSIGSDCFAKYANDADGSEFVFKNNSIISVNSDDVPCIVASKDICIDEEVFVSYGENYWKSRK